MDQLVQVHSKQTLRNPVGAAEPFVERNRHTTMKFMLPTCRGWPTTAHPAKRLQSDPTRATHSERKLSKGVVTGTRAKSGILIPFTLVRSLVRSAVLSDRRSK